MRLPVCGVRYSLDSAKLELRVITGGLGGNWNACECDAGVSARGLPADLSSSIAMIRTPAHGARECAYGRYASAMVVTPARSPPQRTLPWWCCIYFSGEWWKRLARTLCFSHLSTRCPSITSYRVYLRLCRNDRESNGPPPMAWLVDGRCETISMAISGA